MKFVLDQGLPRGAAPALTQRSIDTVHVGDIGMAAAEDVDILAYARQEGRTVVTLDADFHALLALSNATSPSVVRIRAQGLRTELLVAIVAQLVEICGPDLTHGAMITVELPRARVRLLPLVR